MRSRPASRLRFLTARRRLVGRPEVVPGEEEAGRPEVVAEGEEEAGK